MTEERAGIYLGPKAKKAFMALTEPQKQRLAAFLELRRFILERSGGGHKEGCSGIWERGQAVYWDVELKPQSPAVSTEPEPYGTLGSHYRIVVLEIRPLP